MADDPSVCGSNQAQASGRQNSACTQCPDPAGEEGTEASPHVGPGWGAARPTFLVQPSMKSLLSDGSEGPKDSSKEKKKMKLHSCQIKAEKEILETSENTRERTYFLANI